MYFYFNFNFLVQINYKGRVKFLFNYITLVSFKDSKALAVIEKLTHFLYYQYAECNARKKFASSLQVLFLDANWKP